MRKSFNARYGQVFYDAENDRYIRITDAHYHSYHNYYCDAETIYCDMNDLTKEEREDILEDMVMEECLWRDNGNTLVVNKGSSIYTAQELDRMEPCDYFLEITVEEMAEKLTKYQGEYGIGIDEMWNMYRDEFYWDKYLDDEDAFEDFCYMYELFLREEQKIIAYVYNYSEIDTERIENWEQDIENGTLEIIKGHWEDADYCIEVLNDENQQDTVEFFTEEELKDRITSKDFFVYLYEMGDKQIFELDEYDVKKIIARANELIKEE